METPKQMNLGGFVQVPSVQELAKQKLTEIPARYIRTDQEPLTNLSGASKTEATVPVIDLQNLLSADPELELERLHSACKEWGFFQVVNHGVDNLLLEKVKSEVEGFLTLPVNDKKKYEGADEGFGQQFVLSEEQKLDWGDLFYMVTRPLYLRKPHLFPKLPLPLRETMESYTSEVSKLALTLLEMMGKALSIEAGVMAEVFEGGMQAIRMNYYPPCPQPDLVMGVTPHSDFGGLTILLQLNEVEGLQIRNKGEWVTVKPLHNSFIANVGDVTEILTNGLYHSVEHRATINSTKERLSVATFHYPKLDSEIGPLPSMITPKTPALFRRVESYEVLLRKLFTRKLNGKSSLDCMRIGEGFEVDDTA
ncbi:hypothetical protein MKW94_025127 [Papaver nudicaule]|uniref:Fe2OG dioxygenase domain-containing protein n=1 Tax=Papaver nudicaule TaxID=74823 RepID=A0AA42AQS5_PAPNU|nr:hypothetical protein [Papaver nudicaule]